MEYFTIINQSIREKFALLEDCPYELYINFCLKFGEAYGYFALSQILVIYLHEEYNISDIHAGMIYGFWGACITFWGFITSCFNDYFGVRKSLLIGFTISCISNILLALNQNLFFFYIILFGLLPIGNSIGIPMLTVGIKRYTTRKNRGFAYGLFYAVMNIAALASGPVVDFFNVIVCPSHSSCSSTYRHDQQETSSVTTNSTMIASSVTGPNRLITGNRLVIWSVVIVYFLAWMITFFYLREIRVDDKDEEEEEEEEPLEGVIKDEENQTIGPDSSHMLLTSHNNHGKTRRVVNRKPRQANSSSSSTSSSIAVYSSLQVMDGDADDIIQEKDIELTSYKREKGQYSHLSNHDDPDSDVILSPSSINKEDEEQHHSSSKPIPKIVSVYTFVYEIISSLTFWRFCLLTLFLINLNTIFRHVDATLPTYLLRCFGPNYPKGMIYSINPMMIIWLTPTVAAFTSHWPHFDMIKYGGYVSAISPLFLVFSASTWAVVLFMVLLSLGEAIWSPRLYDYTMSIAPEGREASFSALAALPLFAAKIPVGMLSGYLLHTYLREGQSEKEDQEKGKTMWLIIGLLTLSSPILITLCERCIREPEKKKISKLSPKQQDKKILAASSALTGEAAHNPLQQIPPPSSSFTIEMDDDDDDDYGNFEEGDDVIDESNSPLEFETPKNTPKEKSPMTEDKVSRTFSI